MGKVKFIEFLCLNVLFDVQENWGYLIFNGMEQLVGLENRQCD